MEASIPALDFKPYRRIMQMIWDPEPTNDANVDLPVWCLGHQYMLHESRNAASKDSDPTEQLDAIDVNPGGDTTSIAKEDSTSSQLPGQQTQSITTESSQPRPPYTPLNPSHDETSQDTGWPRGFVDDFESRIWMTYRSDFQPIPRSTDPKALAALSIPMRIKSQIMDHNGFTSDSGWGCMIRSGQSLFANALAIQRLGRAWRRGMLPSIERQLLSLFADDPRAPYSIHNFVKHGEERCEIYPGQWFGPTATASSIQALASKNESSMVVYFTGASPEVKEDEFLRVAMPDMTFRPTLILIGTRLGVEKISPAYWQSFLASFQMPQSVGVAGGRPSAAHYFVGTQGSYLFYLDPHYTRRALPYHSDPRSYATTDVDSCHTSRLRRIHVQDMDPSMLIGFLVRDQDDWADWKRRITHSQGNSIISLVSHHSNFEGPFERAGAIDEVESLSDNNDDGDTVLVT